MLGLSADPRAKGPMVYSHYDDDPECHVTAIEEACLSGKLEILRRFSVSEETDDLPELLRSGAVSAHADVIRYLLDLGVPPERSERWRILGVGSLHLALAVRRCGPSSP